MGTAAIIIIILILLVIIGAGAWVLSAYNGFVKMRNRIQESWRQIDVELNRRYELIPNLVETVRAFASHERNTLEDVTRLRNQAASVAQGDGSMPSEARAQTEEALSGAVRNLMVSVEAYPDLKSNTNFLHLQKELSETEDRIAAGRRYYNANVREYNTKIESVPTNMIAGIGNFEKATYFEIKDPAARQAPDVNFGSIAYRDEEKQAPEQYQQQPQHQAPQQLDAQPSQPQYGQPAAPPQQYGQPAAQPAPAQQQTPPPAPQQQTPPAQQTPPPAPQQQTPPAPQQPGGYGTQANYGDQGSYGSQGNYGDQGSYGNQASYGDQGSYGNQGNYGDQGSYGNQNNQGNQGNYGQ